MKSNTRYKRHKPYTVEEKKHFCEAWQKTKLSKSQFIQQNSLPSSFFDWCHTFLPDLATGATSHQQLDGSWLQVMQSTTSKSQLQNTLQPEPIEFKLTLNTVVLSFCMPIEQIIYFIKELNHAAAVIRQ